MVLPKAHTPDCMQIPLSFQCPLNYQPKVITQPWESKKFKNSEKKSPVPTQKEMPIWSIQKSKWNLETAVVEQQHLPSLGLELSLGS